LLLYLDETLVESGVFDVERLNLKKGIGGLQPGEIPVKNPPAGRTFFRIEKIDLDGGRRFGALSLKGEKENKNEK
jgi:hypothetical protein